MKEMPMTKSKSKKPKPKTKSKKAIKAKAKTKNTSYLTGTITSRYVSLTDDEPIWSIKPHYNSYIITAVK